MLLQPLKKNPWRRAGLKRAGAALLALALLGSCGGGTEQVEPFEPTRLIALGDEMSVLTRLDPKGRKYSVNALVSGTDEISCAGYPIWVQVVAETFNFAFEECNPSNQTEIVGYTYARPGAKADDFVSQLAEAELAAGGFSGTQIITVLLGANDVIELYDTLYVPDPTTDTYNAIITEMTRRGTLLGQRINALTQKGPKVIFSTIPRMGYTPYGLQQNIDHLDPGRTAVLNDFSNAFNTAVRVTLINDGRCWGLVELDALINAAISDPANYGLTNITNAACAVALPDCSTATLVPGANAVTWLWASELWISAYAQQKLGDFANGRAVGNPWSPDSCPVQ